MVFDIKKFAVDDGPGIRTTVFLKGCPLRCRWCHNPEGQSSTPELMFRKSRCIQCDECVQGCRAQALSFTGKQLIIDRKKCSLCGECAEKCPADALAFFGRQLTVKDVMSEIDKDSAFYDESKGGVTFSGGEPLQQIDFLNQLLGECRARGVRAAVDTSGYAPWKAIERVLDKVDLFLYDVKLISDAKHRKYTGVSNKLILDNFRKLADHGSRVLVRFPVVPGINDDESNVVKMGELVSSCGVREVCLLPYHKTGIEKYRGLNRKYSLRALKSPSDHGLNVVKGRLEAFGLSVRIGGG